MSDFIEDVRKIVNEMLDDLAKAGDELEAAGKEFDDLAKPLVNAVVESLDAADAASDQAKAIVDATERATVARLAGVPFTPIDQTGS